MSRLLNALRSGKALLMDGAMGSELQRAGLPVGECCEAWNLTFPDRVRAIHQAYGEAGARVFVTNTFQANRPALQRAGGRLDSYLEYLLLKGARLAQEPRFRQLVLLSIGPIVDANGIELGDLDQLPDLQGLDLVDGILLETWSSPRVRYAIRRMAATHRQSPILLSLTYRRDARGRLSSASGHAPQWFARRAAGWGAAALGVNCGREIGMDDVLAIIRRYREHTDLPLFARPNAGTPRKVGRRWVYPRTPAILAQRLPELLEAGVRMVGGCCGTTPAHIAAFRPIVDAFNRKATARRGQPLRPSRP